MDEQDSPLERALDRGPARGVAAGWHAASGSTSNAPVRERAPYLACMVVGLGGLFAGVTGPLLSTFVPPLVRDALGDDQRTAIGVVMALDNVLLLLLVPWAGAVSDRASASGRGRVPLVLAAFVLAAAGMAALPFSAGTGLAGLLGAMILLYSGINLQRAPVQALVADLVPSRFRPLATGSVMFQMCVGAIAFLMLGRILGMRPAFLAAAVTVLAVAVLFAFGVREPTAALSSSGGLRPADPPPRADGAPGPLCGSPDEHKIFGTRRITDQTADASYRSLFRAAWSALCGVVPGLRAVFVAALLVQLTFQTFTTWYALHAIERFGVRPEDVTIGFIAWALGGVIGALPAGVLGVWIGRRNTMLLGFALMGTCLILLDRAVEVRQTAALLGLASASWTLPMVNAYPLFIEPIARHQRGILAALFLLSMALGGVIGDPLNGALFDVAGGFRPLFLMMTAYTALAFLAVLSIPRGTGEPDSGADAELAASPRRS